MKFLIILVCAATVSMAMPGPASLHYGYHGPPAPLGHDGRVVDTPEVAHARAAHLAALAEASSKATYSVPFIADNAVHDYHQTATRALPIVQTATFHGHSGNHGYHGPSAPLDNTGRVVDTPEVAHAKAAHLAAFNHVASNTVHGSYASPESYSQGHSGGYHGFYGQAAPLAHDGRVLDTPEVAQAKAAHLAAYANAVHGLPHAHYAAH